MFSKNEGSIENVFATLLAKMDAIEKKLKETYTKEAMLEQKVKMLEERIGKDNRREVKIIILPPKEAKRLVDEILGYTKEGE